MKLKITKEEFVREASWILEDLEDREVSKMQAAYHLAILLGKLGFEFEETLDE